MGMPMPKNAKKVFQGELFSVWQWEQEMYDGSFATFERIQRADYAYAVGVLDDERLLLVKDEQPDRDWVITPAGGKVDEGETPPQAAEREFEEETGYKAGSLKEWFSYRPNTKLDMEIHAYVARDLELTGQTALEPGERIELTPYTFDEFLQLGENPRLRDWMLKIVMLQAQLHEEKKEELKKIFYE